MEKAVEARQLLLAFEHIQSHGDKEGDEYHLNNIVATSGVDGYDITMTDGQCTVTVNFHNTVHTDGPSTVVLDQFIERLYKLAGKAKADT